MNNELNPPEETYILDMYDTEIYQGEEYYSVTDGLLAENNLEQYVEDFTESLTLAETWEELLEIIEEKELASWMKELLVEQFLSEPGKYFDLRKEALE